MKINDINNQLNMEEYVRKVTQTENPQISNQGMFLKKEKEKEQYHLQKVSQRYFTNN